MHYTVYILYSAKLGKHYVGFTEDLDVRLKQHNEGFYPHCYTSKSNDWELFHSLLCESKRQALKIESHIKRMKSVKYYNNLRQYPEIGLRLLEKYQ